MRDAKGWQTAQGRRQLARLADVLIPGDGELPSATAAEVPGKWVDRVLETRADLGSELTRSLEETTALGAEDGIAWLALHDPDGLLVLKYVLASGYLMNPRVREILHYPGPRANPALPDEAEFDLRDGILEPVKARGSIYRKVDF